MKNNFWTLRSKHGRDLIIANPEVMLLAAEDYIDAVDNDPWHKQEVIKGGDRAGSIIQVPTQRPYTLKGLCHFLDITDETWRNYKERPEFKSAVERVEAFFYDQKFTGATVGAFNANIIARELGLVDKKDVNVESEGLNKGFFELLKQKQTVKEENPQ